jgi:CubicO group peptidase (beta-lactamase class C family)
MKIILLVLFLISLVLTANISIYSGSMRFLPNEPKQFNFADSSGGGITGYTFDGVNRWQAGIVRTGTGKALDDYLSRAAAFGFSGVVFVATGDKIILHKGYGFADREKGVRFTPDTIFPLASIDKTFTATAILKLEEQGKLKTTDSISEYFENVPDDKKNITIHHLLTHSAGLPIYASMGEPITREELVRRMMSAKLKFKPGEKYDYSNPGYSLLAVIVEKVSGMPFDEFVEQHLFRPAGMKMTRPNLSEAERAGLPCGYFVIDLKCRDIDYAAKIADGYSWDVRGNAARFTTTTDLLRWHLALEKGLILSPEQQRKAVTGYVPTNSVATTHYGYGWFVTKTERSTLLAHHGGGDQIVSANYRRFLDEDTVIIEFSNNYWGAYKSIRPQIGDIVFGKTPPVLPKAKIKMNDDALRRYAGKYVLSTGEEFEIIIKNNQVIIPLDANGITKHLVRFPQTEETEINPDTQNKIEKIMEGIAADDYALLQENLWRDVKPEEEKQFWKSKSKQWLKELGKLKRAQVLGKLPGESSLAPGVNLYDNFVLLGFERGLKLVTFKQNPEGRFYIDTSNSNLLPAYFQFVPLSRTEFATYNFMLGTESPVIFQTSKRGSITGITIRGKYSDLSAKKI